MGNAVLTAFFHDVGCTKLLSQCLAVSVARHRDDALGTHLLCGQNAHEANRAITYDGDSLTWANRSSISSEPAGAQNIGSRKQALCLLFGGSSGNLDQGAIGKRNACFFCLRTDRSEERRVGKEGGAGRGAAT